MDKSWRRPLSQHFLHNRRLVSQLVRASSISSRDLVLEIGPGQGIITEALLDIARQVVTVELDGRLCPPLRRRFAEQCASGKLRLVEADFLAVPLPQAPYKVFASVPYSITGDIIRKLLQAANPPSDCSLVVQREAAAKFLAHNFAELPDQARKVSATNSLAALLYYPWWDIRITHHFRRADFSPPPRVDSVLLAITRRAEPLLGEKQQPLYNDFAAYTFGRERTAPRLAPAEFIERFISFARGARPGKLSVVNGAYRKLCAEQQKLHKIHRTRTDWGWRKYRPR